MEFFASEKSQLLLLSGVASQIHLGTGFAFLDNPILARGVSASLHLVLLVAFFGVWLLNMVKGVREDDYKGLGFKGKRVSWYKQSFVCCLCLSVFNIVLCLVTYFHSDREDAWSVSQFVTLLDFGAKTLAWGVTSVYLHTQFSISDGKKLPFLLRLWWGFYLAISCYSSVMDIFMSVEHHNLSTQILVSDIVSVITGLFFCYVGSVGKGEDGLEEPLLGEDTQVVSNIELDNRKGGETVTPFSTANTFSNLTFFWIGSLISLGNKKALDLDDVPQLDSRDSGFGTSKLINDKLEADDSAGNKVTVYKLVKALITSSWKEVVLTAILSFSYTVSSYVGPYLIDTLVQYLTGQRHFKNEGCVLVTAFFLAKFVECLAKRHRFFRTEQVGIRGRAALVAMIYSKGLTLSSNSKQKHTSGEIINFMTVDAERVGEFSWYLHDPWMLVLQVILALLILYKNLGLASVAALLATIVVMLINYPVGKFQEKFQEKLMKSKDKRMRATSEILRNMRILKLQAWEMKFLAKIVDLRKVEEGWLMKFMYTNAMTTFVFWFAPTFVSVATFGTCILLGIPLDSGKILSALATFRILQLPIYDLPDMISAIVQVKVSLDRIVSFLCLPDLQTDIVSQLPRGSSDTAVEITDGNFSWDLASPNLTLNDINLKVCHGMRVAVCGTVGSGKSSLLSCILGEVSKASGILTVSGSKAYVAQSPWIQSGKIEDNILFGKEMNRERYESVLESCSLKKDLEILPHGDQTVIGERGINLSGGQKQRIQIARALYQDADIYLFDDPFSAVDAHTGSHLFKEVLLGLLSSKTVIYVTHQVEFLPAADLVLVIKDGRITQAGKYNEILNSGTDFMELVGAHEKALSALDAVEAGSLSGTISSVGAEDSSAGQDLGSAKNEEKDIKNDKADDGERKGQLVQEEEREKGRVGFSVYWKYLTTAYKGALVPFILLGQVLFQILQISSNYWMAWATPASEGSKAAVGDFTLIMVYVALSIGSGLCVLVRSLLLNTAGYRTATILFKKMHFNIFRSPMSFFDATPSGRILNRASTDQSAVELNIPNLVGGFAFSSIQLLGIIAVMSNVAWPVFIIFIPVIAACMWYQQYYIPSARELSRLIGVCKAPIIQHFAETLAGSTTIRSFDQESRFHETNIKLMDSYSRTKFHTAAAMQWLCFRLDVLSSLTFVVSLILLISIPDGVIDPGVAGLAVTYGLNLNMLQSNVVWCLCNLENKIISVERILQYTSIPSEPPLEIETNRPDQSWPSLGEVNIRNLQVRYAPHLPLVLQGITCTFPGGLKTGIVGRTGSGKSTLIQTLFRLVEPAAGQIIIDSLDISSIGLHDLRSRLSIIPQDPTMFEGTVRSNLDPLEEHTDDQIWEALDKCQLGDEVRRKEGKLDSSVNENGENWSMGQRQLVCLGRVLLKKSKVLVLDEATASVDTATDNLIQQTLREHFSDCTVLTIAHRITSVVDSDMVLLLSNGHVEEYDTPARLLENKSSSFAQLVAEYAGRSSSRFG